MERWPSIAAKFDGTYDQAAAIRGVAGCAHASPMLIGPCLLERTALARRPNQLEPDPRHAVVAHTQLVRGHPGQIDDPATAVRAPIIDPHHDGLPGLDGCHLHPRAERQAAVRGH